MHLIDRPGRGTGQWQVAAPDHVSHGRGRIAQAHLGGQIGAVVGAFLGGRLARDFLGQDDVIGQQPGPRLRPVITGLGELYRIGHPVWPGFAVHLLHRWRVVECQEGQLAVDLEALAHGWAKGRIGRFPQRISIVAMSGEELRERGLLGIGQF